MPALDNPTIIGAIGLIMTFAAYPIGRFLFKTTLDIAEVRGNIKTINDENLKRDEREERRDLMLNTVVTSVHRLALLMATLEGRLGIEHKGDANN